MLNTTDNVWLITGASSGLGLALLQDVLARGDRVIGTARSLASFKDVLNDPSIDQSRLHVLVLDVSSPFAEIKEKIDAAINVWGRIDVVVNNAGAMSFGLTEELGAEGIMKDLQTNFFGILNVNNAVLPHMRARRSGTIVLTGSRSTYRNQLVGIGSYSASKAAVQSYGETLAAELDFFNIRVLVVVPGGFATKFNAPKRAGEPLPGYETMRARMDAAVPMYAKIPKGDPALGMSALVDVVRGEGRAEGRGMPLWLFLGEDSISDVDKRLRQMETTIEHWKDVGSNLGLPEMTKL
ncbi:NAD-P-binding protein [Gloeopeniophorella convolvens]|nr:NAD-P-binding protein [Gloeopeniophorella convolvens]